MRQIASRLLLALVFLWTGLAWGVDRYEVESAPPDVFQNIPKALAAALDPQGARMVGITRSNKTILFDVWWRKQVPTRATSRASHSLIYNGLRPGTLLGVVNYFTVQEDFQHHTIRPGLYTMRYAELDQSRDSADDDPVSPFRDFVLLSPAWTDKTIDIVPLKELLKRSQMVTHLDDPAALSLVPVNPAYKTLPWAIADDRGFCVLQAQTKQRTAGKSRDFTIAVILVRPPYENEGS